MLVSDCTQASVLRKHEVEEMDCSTHLFSLNPMSLGYWLVGIQGGVVIICIYILLLCIIYIHNVYVIVNVCSLLAWELVV